MKMKTKIRREDDKSETKCIENKKLLLKGRYFDLQIRKTIIGEDGKRDTRNCTEKTFKKTF